MPTTLTNQARIVYTYTGGPTETADSNRTVTTLLDEYSLTAVKTALTATFRPGSNATYQVLVTNNGRGPVYNIAVVDNLGSATTARPLTYLAGSARLFQNGGSAAVTPTAGSNGMTFTLTDPLLPGESVLITYVATVSGNLAAGVNSITNTAAVTGNGGSAAGPVVTVTPSPSATITRENYANVSIYKQADKSSVVSGEPLTYTFTMSNSGSIPATGVTITDTFPANFTVNQVSLTVNGATTAINPSDYTIDTGNTFTLPADSSALSITIPPAAGGVPGVATLTVTGTVNA